MNCGKFLLFIVLLIQRFNENIYRNFKSKLSLKFTFTFAFRLPKESITSSNIPSDSSTSEKAIEQIPVVQEEYINLDAPSDVDVELELNKSEPSQFKLLDKEEEHPIPLFSEWAQQQMQEAEKKEEEHHNATILKQSKNATKVKTQVIKLRAKNYASPDCKNFNYFILKVVFESIFYSRFRWRENFSCKPGSPKYRFCVVIT